MRYLDKHSPLARLYWSYEEYRYPYGLVFARLWEDKEEWCQVGIFNPRIYGLWL